MTKQISKVKAKVETDEARVNNYDAMLVLRNRLAAKIPMLEENLKSLRANLPLDAKKKNQVAKEITLMEADLAQKNSALVTYDSDILPLASGGAEMSDPHVEVRQTPMEKRLTAILLEKADWDPAQSALQGSSTDSHGNTTNLSVADPPKQPKRYVSD